MQNKRCPVAHPHQCGGCPSRWRYRTKWCADKLLRFCAHCKERRRRKTTDRAANQMSRVQAMSFKAGLELATGGPAYVGGTLPGKTFEECLKMKDCPACAMPPGCCDCTEAQKTRARDRRLEAQWNESGKPVRLRKERPRKGHKHLCPACEKKRDCTEPRAKHPAGIIYRLPCDSCRRQEETRQRRERDRQVRNMKIVMRG